MTPSLTRDEVGLLRDLCGKIAANPALADPDLRRRLTEASAACEATPDLVDDEEEEGLPPECEEATLPLEQARRLAALDRLVRDASSGASDGALVRAWCERADFHAALGRHDAARADVDHALARNPNSSRALKTSAMCHHRRGGLELAIHDIGLGQSIDYDDELYSLQKQWTSELDSQRKKKASMANEPIAPPPLDATRVPGPKPSTAIPGVDLSNPGVQQSMKQMMADPSIMAMAERVMQDPQMMQTMQTMMHSLGGAQTPP